MSDETLYELGRDAWELHRQAAGKPWLVTPSAPVLFFGDLSAFQASPLRIATVALNPSRREFPVGAPFSRFPGVAPGDMRIYFASLSNYFQVDSYPWFDCYEQALLGLGASYKGQQPNIAIHTDIASVLPTDPTWGRLDRHAQDEIAASGVPLWHRLIMYLKPQILLWSTATSWHDLIKLDPISRCSDLIVFRETQSQRLRRRPVIVRICWYQMPAAEQVLIAFIPAAQKPLGTLSHSQKRMTGEAILNAWRTHDKRT
jgi:hypothetical protein